MQLNRRVSLISLLTFLSATADRTLGAPVSLETLVYSVAGQSGFGTYTAPPLVVEFFNGQGASLPANGLPVGGLPGIERHTVASSGVLTDAGFATGNGLSTNGIWSASGFAFASASFGKVGARGAGTSTGIGDSNTIVGFEGVGMFTESFTIDSPSLAPSEIGFATLHWTIDGLLARLGTAGAAGIEVNVQQDLGPIFSVMRALVQAGVASDLVPRSGPGHDGFTIMPDSISGSGVFDTAPLGFVAGTPFDFRLGVLAYSLPRGGSVTNFNAAATLTGIEIVDRFGQPVTEFSITSGSGAYYDARGVRLVPEPTSSLLAWATCLVVLLFLSRPRSCSLAIRVPRRTPGIRRVACSGAFLLLAFELPDANVLAEQIWTRDGVANLSCTHTDINFQTNASWRLTY